MVFSAPQRQTDTASQRLPGARQSSAKAPINQAVIKNLQTQIHRAETAHRANPGETISTGCAAMDRLLPGHGYAKGTLVQWLSNGGYGVDYLSLLTAREACRSGGALIVVDPLRQFYPPAAAAIGINMGNLIVLRESGDPSDLSNDWLWSIDQALRCSAVGAVWGLLPSFDERWFRRFQLSAESSGCLGLFLQTLQEARKPSWAEVQWLVTNASSHSPRPLRAPSQPTARQQRLQVQMTRCRGARTGKKLSLSIDTVTGMVRPDSSPTTTSATTR